MEQLNYEKLVEISGGGYTETFVDSEGWKWVYEYNDNGDLLGYCVIKHQITMIK